ncbi:hypothetical protein FPQ18DRAFT_308192 [Pyronema domesticum]|nr:hypothetical protein FPQ18DRAFT_308192 [Pyronema domesticum]
MVFSTNGTAGAIANTNIASSFLTAIDRQQRQKPANHHNESLFKTSLNTQPDHRIMGGFKAVDLPPGMGVLKPSESNAEKKATIDPSSPDPSQRRSTKHAHCAHVLTGSTGGICIRSNRLVMGISVLTLRSVRWDATAGHSGWIRPPKREQVQFLFPSLGLQSNTPIVWSSCPTFPKCMAIEDAKPSSLAMYGGEHVRTNVIGIDWEYETRVMKTTQQTHRANSVRQWADTNEARR